MAGPNIDPPGFRGRVDENVQASRPAAVGEARTFPPAAGLLRSRGTDEVNAFVPVATGSRGRRGFDHTPTRRLRQLFDRYRSLRDDPAIDPGTRAYAREIVAELHDEFARRGQSRTVAA